MPVEDIEVIPAIDLKEGCCVRLTQGKFEQEEVFSQDPVKMAGHWQEQGAGRLHVVDLDGAKDGEPRNISLIKEMVDVLEIPVQLGGGIRTQEIMEEYLTAGVERVIVGTMALKNPELLKNAVDKFSPDKIVVGVDAKEGKVAVKGWLETSEQTVVETIERLKKIGINTFIYTDISRDGMLTGPDLKGLKELIELKAIELIASGGVSSREDLEQLSEIGIRSAIVGKALYTGEIDYEQLWK